jgi:hypothetical protein
VWPAVLTAVGLAVFGTLVVVYRRAGGDRLAGHSRQWALAIAGSLLALQTVYLVVADIPVFGSSSTPYPRTPGVVALQRTVGSSLVGFGVGPISRLGLGLAPEANIDYGIHEFAEYDPIAPLSFFTSWNKINGSGSGLPSVYYFVPAISSADVARRYGVAYVLEHAGVPGPSGSVFAAHVGDEDLYRVPGAATATLVPVPHSGGWPSTDAAGQAVAVERPAPSQMRIVTDSRSSQVLRVRLTALPGWHATIDGHPLALSTYLTWMFQARIPPGHHVIEFSYWPKRFSEGILIAVLTVIAFGVAGLVVRRRIRARSKQPLPPSDPGVSAESGGDSSDDAPMATVGSA